MICMYVCKCHVLYFFSFPLLQINPSILLLSTYLYQLIHTNSFNLPIYIIKPSTPLFLLLHIPIHIIPPIYHYHNLPPFHMPTLKTNHIRTDITSQCYRYQFQLLSNQPFDPKYHHQLQSHFLSINQFIVFSYPYIYSIDQLNLFNSLTKFYFMLSNSLKIQVHILVANTITLNSKEISIDIHQQLMKNTNFLYSDALNICLNPFEQRKLLTTNNTHTSIMPGFTIVTESTQSTTGFYLIPLQAKITPFHSLSSLHQYSIILDYDSGTFYQKLSIVRYDKLNEIVYFRTGQQVNKNSLKSLEILPLNGFELAMKISAYYKRLRESEKLKKFIQKWEIKFDSRFMQLPYNFFPVGHIILANKQQKSLGQCLGSINAFNFQYNFRKLLATSNFDENMRTVIYFLLPQIYTSQKSQESTIDLEQPLMEYYGQLIVQQQEWMALIISQIEKLKLRMKLNDCKIIILKYDVFVGWANGMSKTIKQIQQIVERQSLNTNCDKLFVLSNVQDLIREERQSQFNYSQVLTDLENSKPLYKSITEYFVQNGIYYHLIQTKQNDFRKCPDIVALKTLASIQCKLRLNPLKIKDIPFGTKPLMVLSVYVKHETDGTVTISAIGSLNAFLSKYTCLIVNCSYETYQNVLLQTVIQTMKKFNSIHKIFPKRIMIFRRGDFTHFSEDQFSNIEQTLTEKYSCKPTYVLITVQTPLRVYNQIDYNYISKDTVKPTQMLCQIKYNNQRYIQLQNDSPMHCINILGVDHNQINFEQKVVELTTKLCLTYQVMLQMKFGKGLGFVGYAQKMHKWSKEFSSIKGTQACLKEGVLMFL